MVVLFAIIFILSLIALPVALIKPSFILRSANATRKKASLIVAGVVVTSFILTGVTAPTPESQVEGEQTEATATPTATSAPTITKEVTKTLTPTKAPQAPTATKKATPTVKPPTPTPTVAKIQQSTTGTSSSGGGDKDCGDFSSHSEAQAYFLSKGGSPSSNVDRLDNDHDGIACEDI